MRNKNGQFIKGEHWRPHQPFRDKDWLEEHYSNNQMSAGEIATMFGVTASAIIFWLKNHGIPRRNVSQARAIKSWGSTGASNPMWGKFGEQNPHWKGGISPERSLYYQTQEWKSAFAAVWERDKAMCQRCGASLDNTQNGTFHVHHILPFSHKETRAEITNLVLLCPQCHRFVHSRRNTNNDYIQEI